MVGAAVDAIDHSISGALQFVVEAAIDQPPDDRRIEAFGREHIARRSALDTAFGQSAVHPFDDVAPLAESTQCGLGLVVDHPLARTNLLGETKGFQLAQASDFQGMEFIGLLAGNRRNVDDAVVAAVTNELAVELGPAFGLNLAIEIAADVKISARSQFLRDEIGGAGRASLP